MIPRLVIFDVDDVFIDMDLLADKAVDGAGDVLVEHLGTDGGERVRRRFAEHYDTLRSQLRSRPEEQTPDFLALRDAITRWQSAVLEAKHPLKIWSRETMLAVALEREGFAVDGALVHAVVDAYWSVLKAHSRLFEDARRAVERFRRAGAHVHLATNSDGNLSYDAATKSFGYDPEHARATKASRLEVLREADIDDEHLTIGDPIGKPDPAFFQGALRAAMASVGDVPLDRVLAIGDSYSDDLKPLLDLGVTRGVWLLRRKAPDGLEVDPRVTIVRSLDEVEVDG